MTTNEKTKPTAAAKPASNASANTGKPASQKPKATTTKRASAGNVGSDKSASNVKSSSNKADSWQHIADQIKAFPSKRVWPD